MYVQLSRLRSSKGLHLLQKLDMHDLRFGPEPRLLTEMERLQEHEKRRLPCGRKLQTYKLVLYSDRIRQSRNVVYHFRLLNPA